MSVEAQGFEPKIIVFACNWCTYAAADLAGLNHLEYPAEVRIERIKCSGRLDPLFLLQAYKQGADGVIVAGCRDNDCYLGSDYMYDQRKHEMFSQYLCRMGVEGERYRAAWKSGMENHTFTDVFSRLKKDLKRLGPYQKPD